ncbi:Peptidyl-tRNA hydrolase [Porphyridium purpureum]|uniref:Peptidyl-tRNA hydrolase n=1 Tax=Porphyridium purpureum TaxID=35688 RepID=A0A5J4YSD9_PORPP|nr:Peptidyl-tRNA hydrolase [Porphyridium purpureum]|eukprot:POR0235..scf236_6
MRIALHCAIRWCAASWRLARCMCPKAHAKFWSAMAWMLAFVGHPMLRGGARALSARANALSSRARALPRVAGVTKPARLLRTTARAAAPDNGPRASAAKDAGNATKGAAGQEEPAVARGDRLLIVGLGNPGKEYELTRHNIGFHVVESLAVRMQAAPFKPAPKFQAMLTETVVNGRTVHFMKPTTFMNLSGRAVNSFVSFYKIPRSAIMVIVDDVNLGFGRLRLREKGTHGGQNGLRSIQNALGQNYTRLRVGVDSPAGGDLADYVLSKFKRSEQKELETIYWYV